MLSVILAGVLFLVTAAKLVKKLQFRNMKVSAFAFRKEAKKKCQIAPHYGDLYVGCCMLQSQQEDSTTIWQHTGTLHRLRAPILNRGSTCLKAHQSWWSIIYDVV